MPIEIPFYGLSRFYQRNSTEFVQLFEEAFSGGQFVDGRQTNQLESCLALYTGRNYAVSTASGTDALFFALLAAELDNSCEVLVPALSFIASATAITRCGATPVFVDVLPGNALMDIEDARRKVSSKTKAIVFVDLYGNMPDFKQIEDFALEHGLVLIEDAAQALGSQREGRCAGSLGEISILSFDPSKPIGAFGTGGAVLTNNRDIAQRCLQMRQNGKNPATSNYDGFGINSRMSEFQAAVVNFQMEQYNEILTIRREKANRYSNNLKRTDIKILVCDQFSYLGNFHKFVLHLNERNRLKEFLNAHGVQTMIHYEQCLYEHKVLSRFATSSCPNATILSNTVLSIPFYPELEDQEIDFVSHLLNSFE